jgi:hypothetical protein
MNVHYTNSQTDNVAGVMPRFEVFLANPSGSSYLSTLEAFKGYWHFPLDKES